MSNIGSVSSITQTLLDIALQQQIARVTVDTKVLATALDVQEQIGNELVSLIVPIDQLGQNIDVIA